MSVTVVDRFKVIVRSPGPQGPAGPAGGGGGGSGTVTSVIAGDGLLGGNITTSGTIDCNFGTAGNTVCAGNDARLSDARTPTAHTHVAGDIGSITGPALIGRQAATSGTAEAITLGSGLTIDGSKQLTITAAYAQQSVTMTAGTGLTGGGDLSANRTFAVAYGSTASTACEGNDARLSDARSPTAHTHALADIQQGGATSGQVLEWSGTAWAPATLSGGGGGTVTSVTAGTGLTGGTITGSGTIAADFGNAAGTICQGNDARLSDARTPTSHLHTIADVTDISAFGSSLIDDANAAAARTTLGLGGAAEKDASFYATASHTHALADLQQGGATSGQVVAWNGTAWAPATPSGGGGGGGGAPPVNEKSVVFDTFLNTTTPDTMVFTAASGGSVGSADIRSDDRFGGVNIDSGVSAVANAHATWRMSNSATVGNFDDLASAQYTTEIKGLNLADGTTTGLVYVGLARFSSTAGSDPSHGVYLRSTDGGNWYAVTRASGTETATDTGVGTNTTTWQRLTCKYTSSSCTFYIDGVLKATHTTNIPTTDANYGMSVVKTAAVTTRVRYSVDWVYAELEWSPALSLD